MNEIKELAVLKGQVSKLENQAQAVTITSPETYAQAVDIVAKLKDTGSKVKEKKESITKPLNEALKNARNLFKPIEDQFASAEQIVKGKLLAYKREQDEIALAKEAEIAEKVDAGRMKLETGEKKMAEIQRVDNTTRGKVGEVQIRKIKKVRIVSPKLLPREYLVPDEVRIRRDALSGIPIPGVEVYEEESIASGRF